MIGIEKGTGTETRRTKRHGLNIQPRDLDLLREDGIMRVADREQLKIAAGFHSTTRINARLLALTRAGLLRRFFIGAGSGRKSLYALSAKGGQLVHLPLRGPRRRQNEVLVADFFVQHQLAVNTVYCDLKFGEALPSGVEFVNWLAFFESISPSVGLIPDGYVEVRTHERTLAAFLEVDLGHERLAVWTAKAKHYVQFAVSGEFARGFRHRQFRVLVLVNSKRRLLSIRAAVADVTEKIFWFATLEDARGEKFSHPVWLRPERDNYQPLFEQPS